MKKTFVLCLSALLLGQLTFSQKSSVKGNQASPKDVAKITADAKSKFHLNIDSKKVSFATLPNQMRVTAAAVLDDKPNKDNWQNIAVTVIAPNLTAKGKHSGLPYGTYVLQSNGTLSRITDNKGKVYSEGKSSIVAKTTGFQVGWVTVVITSTNVCYGWIGAHQCHDRCF